MATKILAIDDSKTMRLAIKITFAAENAEVTSVGKGSDAVARIKAKQGGYDLVLVDANLAPGEPSGYEVCKAIKGDPATSSIPVVLLVSNQTGVDQAKLTDAGGDGFIAKPFDTQELIDKVAEVQGQAPAKPATAAAAPAAAARPARPVSGPQPVVAPPPGGARTQRTANRTQMGIPAPAVAPPPKPATPAPKPAVAAKPAAAPKPAAATPAPRPAAATPAPRPAAPAPAPARPAATPAVSRPATPTPAPQPSVATARPAPSSDGAIPIAIPIPFTAADSPTPGMSARLQQAAGSAGVDPKVAELLASLSREVIEKIVWEVVPELAESIIKEQQAKSA